MRRLTAEAAMCSRRAAPAMLPASAIAKNNRMVTMSKLCMTPLRLRLVALALRGGLRTDPGLPPEVLGEGLQGLRPPILDGLRPFANVYSGKQQSDELSDRRHGNLHLAAGLVALIPQDGSPAGCRPAAPGEAKHRESRRQPADRSGGGRVPGSGF